MGGAVSERHFQYGISRHLAGLGEEYTLVFRTGADVFTARVYRPLQVGRRRLVAPRLPGRTVCRSAVRRGFWWRDSGSCGGGASVCSPHCAGLCLKRLS